jgi:lysophospholipase L1-like esterase
MANKKPDVYPETGWCQVLNQFFDEEVIVKNHAVNGRSSKSFITEGRWKVVLDSLKKGDYVFIQFGHNDEKEYDTTRYTTPFGTYTENLKRFIRETREKGATPVLLTPIARRKFDDSGKLTDTHGQYPEAVRKVADEMKVALIDLQKRTAELISATGNEPSKKLFLWTEPSNRFPEGRKDDTHLSVEGATQISRLAVEDLKKLHLKLSKHVRM